MINNENREKERNTHREKHRQRQKQTDKKKERSEQIKGPISHDSVSLSPQFLKPCRFKQLFYIVVVLF